MIKSTNYNAFLLLTVFACGSGISISSQLSLFLALTVLLVGVNVTAAFFSDKPLLVFPNHPSTLFVSLFFVITFYTMLVRGIGFEALGSSKSGGMFYLRLFSVLLLFLFTVRAKASERYLSALFVAFFISCTLPFLADILYLLFQGETPLHKLIPGSTTIRFYAENETGLLRIQSAASVAEYLFVLMMAYNPVFGANGRLTLNKKNVAVVLATLVLIGLSGHRITLIGIALLLLFYYSRSFGWQKLMKPLLIGGSVVAMICVFAILRFEHLPPTFQRTFSFLPFTPVNEVTLDASDSLNFRLLMAAKALAMLPDFYLIGKGFAFYNYSVDISDFFGTIDLFAEIGVFHNGLLGLLINLGIPGLLVGIALIRALYKMTGQGKKTELSPLLTRLLLVLKCKLLVSILYFFFLYGDVQTNFIEIVLLAFLYKFIYAAAPAKQVTVQPQ